MFSPGGGNPVGFKFGGGRSPVGGGGNIVGGGGRPVGGGTSTGNGEFSNEKKL